MGDGGELILPAIALCLPHRVFYVKGLNALHLPMNGKRLANDVRGIRRARKLLAAPGFVSLIAKLVAPFAFAPSSLLS